jgi:hypothetical protein
MAGAARGAAEAEDAFVVAVELAALLPGLEPFLLGIWGLGVEPRFDHLVLRKDMSEIKDQVLDNSHIRQGIDRRWRAQVGNEPRAGEPVRAIHIHGAGAADALAARAAEGERRVDVALNPGEGVQDHWAAIIEINFERIDTRIIPGVRIIAIDLECLHSPSVSRGWPRPSSSNARRRRNAKVSWHRKSLQHCDARHLI